MTAPRVHRIREHYEQRVAPERETFDILDWSSRESQTARFRVLVSLLREHVAPASHPSLLDVGCGMTDLAAHLEENAFPVLYVGVDITFAILAEVKRRFPERRVFLGDVFGTSPLPDHSVDVCYCSGIFNLQLGNNEQFALEALPRLVSLSRSLVVANFLHHRTAWKHPHCHYFDPNTITRAMERLGLQVTIIDDYLDNDFTVALRQP